MRPEKKKLALRLLLHTVILAVIYFLLASKGLPMHLLYVGGGAILALVYVIYNRGFVWKNATEETLPDSMSLAEKRELLRETREELGINAEGCELVQMYEFHSDREHELVYAYKIVYDKEITPSNETDGGRFWSMEEIHEAIGQGTLTPNVEQEFMQLFGKKDNEE